MVAARCALRAPSQAHAANRRPHSVATDPPRLPHHHPATPPPPTRAVAWRARTLLSSLMISAPGATGPDRRRPHSCCLTPSRRCSLARVSCGAGRQPPGARTHAVWAWGWSWWGQSSSIGQQWGEPWRPGRAQMNGCVPARTGSLPHACYPFSAGDKTWTGDWCWWWNANRSVWLRLCVTVCSVQGESQCKHLSNEAALVEGHCAVQPCLQGVVLLRKLSTCSQPAGRPDRISAHGVPAHTRKAASPGSFLPTQGAPWSACTAQRGVARQPRARAMTAPTAASAHAPLT